VKVLAAAVLVSSLGALARRGGTRVGPAPLSERKTKISRENAKSARREEDQNSLDHTIRSPIFLGALGVFARDLLLPFSEDAA